MSVSRDEIERVIDDLETKKEEAHKGWYRQPVTDGETFVNHGKEKGLNYAIDRLKDLL